MARDAALAKKLKHLSPMGYMTAAAALMGAGKDEEALDDLFSALDLAQNDSDSERTLDQIDRILSSLPWPPAESIYDGATTGVTNCPTVGRGTHRNIAKRVIQASLELQSKAPFENRSDRFYQVGGSLSEMRQSFEGSFLNRPGYFFLGLYVPSIKNEDPTFLTAPFDVMWCLLRPGDSLHLSSGDIHHVVMVHSIDRTRNSIRLVDPWPSESSLLEGRNFNYIRAELVRINRDKKLVQIQRSELNKVLRGLLSRATAEATWSLLRYWPEVFSNSRFHRAMGLSIFTQAMRLPRHIPRTPAYPALALRHFASIRSCSGPSTASLDRSSFRPSSRPDSGRGNRQRGGPARMARHPAGRARSPMALWPYPEARIAVVRALKGANG